MKLVRAGILSLLGCSATLLPLGVDAGENLRVGAGETHQLSATDARTHFESWILGDGATLVLPAGPEQWRLQVDRARIGQGVRILGRGTAGADGKAGASLAGSAAACHAGRPGGAGLAGDPGSAGASLDLSLGIEALGSLAVDLSGGAGGQGGIGGNGENGGAAQQCSGGDGGAGGNGGDGGDGGSGGNAHIRYSFLSERGAPGDVAITVTSEAGSGGPAGAPGHGGSGNQGQFIQTRTLSGNQRWVDGGSPGRTGDAGKAGRAGSKGQSTIEQDLNQRLDQLIEKGRITSPPPAATRPATDRTEELERKLDAALRRLEALEKRSP